MGLLLFGVLFLAGGVAFLVRGLRGLARRAAQLRAWRRLPGHLVELIPDKDLARAVIEYATPDGAKARVTTRWAARHAGAVGDPVDVLASPDGAHVECACDLERERRAPLAALVLGGAFAGFGLLVVVSSLLARLTHGHWLGR